jgi:two-component system, chemotaxis family, CheB/CheR fusion protein
MPESESKLTPPVQSTIQPKLRSLQGANILVVDDEEDILELIATILETSGATVTAVGSARAALHALQAQPLAYDLLLSDLGMPEEDGWTLIRQIRALDAASGGQIPAAALTAYNTMKDRNISHAFGFQILISKPIEPAELVADVLKLIGKPISIVASD